MNPALRLLSAFFPRVSTMISAGLCGGLMLFSVQQQPTQAAGKIYDPVAQDPVIQDQKYLPRVYEVVFDSAGVRLYGKVYAAQGAAPRPTILIARGFPDMTSGADLALILQRAGYNVMMFSFRGSWGMDGIFTMENAYQDLQAATAFLRSYRSSLTMQVDPNNIVVYGYSLGGPLALRLAAEDARIRGVIQLDGLDMRVMQLDIGDQTKPALTLRSIAVPTANSQRISADVASHWTEWNPTNYAAKLQGKSVLLLWAARGNGGLTNAYGPSLATMYGKTSHLTEKTLQTDHDFADSRIALARTVLGWLKQVPMQAPSLTEKPPAVQRKPVQLSAAQMENYVGTYELNGIRLFARIHQGQLQVADANQEWKQVSALEAHRFVVQGEEAKDCADIEANEDLAGNVLSFTQHCSRQSMEWKHISNALLFPPERTYIDADDAVLAAYAGEYAMPAGMRVEGMMQVRVDGKRLIATPPVGGRVILYALSDTLFVDKAGSMEMLFVKDSKGNISHIDMRMQGREYRFQRR
jgi:hypothetical protein